MPDESTVERYRDAAIALLPPGRAIAKALDTNIADLMTAIAVEFARIHEEAATLRQNAIPGKTVEMLDQWEEALGLPGECVTTPTQNTAERQGAIIAKLRGRTSHARSAYEATAAALGYTDLQFVTFDAFSCTSECTGSLYGDEWANVVRVYAPVGDQTADDSLVCIFVDQLRRSHGFLDIVLEGPMGAVRNTQALFSNDLAALAASTVLSTAKAISINYGGHLSLQCLIDTVGDGSGSAPSDTPSGTWQIWCSVNGNTYTQLTSAAITTELAKIAPNGNNKVGAWAVFDGIPGTSVKVLYSHTSGGGTTAKCSLLASAW